MKTTLRLLGFLKPYSGWVAFSVLLGVATIASNIGLLGSAAYLIASAALHPSIAELQVAIVGVRFFGIGRGVFRYLERLVTHSVNFQLLGQVRVWFFQRLEPLAPAGLQDSSSGDLLSRAIGDIEALQEFYVRVVSPVITAVIITMGMGIFVGFYDPLLGLILVSGLAASGVAVPLLVSRMTTQLSRRIVTLRSSQSAAMVELIQGLADLLAFNQADRRLGRLGELAGDYGNAQTWLGWRMAAASAANLMVVNLVLWLIIFTATPLVRNGSLQGVDLAVLSLITLASFEAVSGLGQAAQNLQSTLPAAVRLFELADQVPPVAEPDHPLPAPTNIGLRIQDVSFSYPGRAEPALDGVSFDLPPGKRIAITGYSGAGKSTIFNLLLRFWEPWGGRILLEGRDIRAYAAPDTRAGMGVILQDERIFSGTLRENLLLADPAANDRALFSVLERARLLTWAGGLQNGLDTWLGERGARMSGGERQRLAIARLFLKKSHLYLLDEPTSQIDPHTSQELALEILDVTRGHSLIWITHDLSSLEKMDELLVMERGKIVERGSHSGLLSRQGVYASLSGTFKQGEAS